jgi:uncharacterized protein
MTMKDKHIPLRTCIACREIKDKRLMIRLVRNSDGSIELDTSAKKKGRGAYICASKRCWDIALKKNHLDHALRTKINNANRNALFEYGSKFNEEK